MKKGIHQRHWGISFVLGGTLFLSLFFFSMAVMAGTFKTSIPKVVDPRYEVQILVPGSYFHGIHGITFDDKDNLYAGSVIGNAIYKVDTDTGEVKEFIGPPVGMADDLEFGPDGRLYYTSILHGKLRVRNQDGSVAELADGLMGMNSLAFNKEGRLFASQVFMGDALHEIDLSGQKNNRKIAEGLGGLNGFDFGPDDMLYGPLWFKGCIVCIDVETGKIETVADGFVIPAAVNFDSKGNLFAVDSGAGEVVQVDTKTGKKTLIAKVDPSIDNLAIDSKDRIFISNFINNGIYEIDKKSGRVRTIIEGKICLGLGVAVVNSGGGETIYMADIFSYKKIDGFTGEVTNLMRSYAPKTQIVAPNQISAYKNYTLLTDTMVGMVQVIDTKTNKIVKTIRKLKRPWHALMLDNGSILVTEIPTGSLIEVTGEKGEQRKVIAKELVTPCCLAPAGKDAVYVTEVMAGKVTRISLADGAKKVIAAGLKLPTGIGILPNGKLVVVEGGKRQLVEIDSDSGNIKPLVTELAIGYPPGGPPPGSLIQVAVSDAGNIYLTSDIEKAVYKIRKK